ncbi:hypothetical protein FN846DRAFT_893500 [Sphaerosporella brunnea]|uniref:Uncharacterized protein n=1 Tax=Sphaerosporella brunnea TaxID=1250544 RepID=A0A5J5EMA3_9PEZI|nr:hypothetical protein FN846DRAFT_893500 [Sphaerosporella brunnea]
MAYAKAVVTDKLGDTKEAALVHRVLDVLGNQRDEFKASKDISIFEKEEIRARYAGKQKGKGKGGRQKLSEARCTDWAELEARELEAREQDRLAEEKEAEKAKKAKQRAEKKAEKVEKAEKAKAEKAKAEKAKKPTVTRRKKQSATSLPAQPEPTGDKGNNQQTPLAGSSRPLRTRKPSRRLGSG